MYGSYGRFIIEQTMSEFNRKRREREAAAAAALYPLAIAQALVASIPEDPPSFSGSGGDSGGAGATSDFSTPGE